MEPNKPRTPTHREVFLAEMECTVPWTRVRALIEPICADPVGSGLRPELDRMLRIYFLQRWFRLTDAAVREAIVDSSAMRAFACTSLGRTIVPEEEEIREFRRLLQEYGVAEMIVHAADCHLKSMGLSVAPGAIVDATVTRTPRAYAQAPFARIIDTAGFAAG